MKRALFPILISIALGACGPGPTAEPTTAAQKPAPKPVAECPPRPPATEGGVDKLTAITGKKIAKMCLYGLEGDPRTTAQKALRSHEADPVDLERIREDIGNLIKTGVVDDVTISALPVEGSGAPAPAGSAGAGAGAGGAVQEVILIYVLKERRRIADLGFEGAKVFEKEGLTGKIAMEKQRPLVMSEVHDLMAAMRDEYNRRGYRSVKIDAKLEDAGPGMVRLKFVVVEGPQWKIGKVSFKGAKQIAEADLKKAVAIDLKEGAPFDDEKIERAAQLANSLYFDRGMIQARVDRTTGEPDKDGNTPLGFVVDEGDVFRVGSVKLGKLAAADEKTLLGKLKTKPKQIFNRSQLVDDVKTLTEAFAARGQKVEVLPRTDVDAKKKTLDLTLDVEASP